MLTEALVTRPAKSSVTPKARTMGQAVGAGRLTVAGAASGASVFMTGEAISFRSLFLA
jgi:hypothetical protein